MSGRAEYLVVDGHSVIFAWPDLRKLHSRRSSLARDELVKRLQHYQDWTGIRVVVVFDGKGERSSSTKWTENDVQIFYSASGQTADAIIERLASKYARHFAMTVVTSDRLEELTATTFGATCISPETFQALVREALRSHR